MPKLRRSKETVVFPSRVGHLNALAFRRIRRTRRRNLRVGPEIDWVFDSQTWSP